MTQKMRTRALLLAGICAVGLNLFGCDYKERANRNIRLRVAGNLVDIEDVQAETDDAVTTTTKEADPSTEDMARPMSDANDQSATVDAVAPTADAAETGDTAATTTKEANPSTEDMARPMSDANDQPATVQAVAPTPKAEPAVEEAAAEPVPAPVQAAPSVNPDAGCLADDILLN